MTPGQKMDLLNSNITNMKRKNLLPFQTLGYWDQTPDNLWKLVHATEAQAFKEWKCPECMITVYGPNKMLLEHHKIHSQKRERGENEVFQRSYKLYR